MRLEKGHRQETVRIRREFLVSSVTLVSSQAVDSWLFHDLHYQRQDKTSFRSTHEQDRWIIYLLQYITAGFKV